jgi:uncharacterized membrane protein
MRKRSLSKSGGVAAYFVGFVSLAVSYRFGLILLLFYYTSSSMTKFKEAQKAKLESNYQFGGQRDATQVLANSFLASLVAIAYFFYVGEDTQVMIVHLTSFHFVQISRTTDINFYLWCLYISHYSCAAADTWASELGILSSSKPRLVTSLFFRVVPPGTNGGMSLLGTIASFLGGSFIGFVFFLFSYALSDPPTVPQYPMIFVGSLCGVLGSLFDSLLGATLQATYYSTDRQCVVKSLQNNSQIKKDESVVLICGYDLLTNEQVNLVSILMTMICSIPIGWFVFSLF